MIQYILLISIFFSISTVLYLNVLNTSSSSSVFSIMEVGHTYLYVPVFSVCELVHLCFPHLMDFSYIFSPRRSPFTSTPLNLSFNYQFYKAVFIISVYVYIEICIQKYIYPKYGAFLFLIVTNTFQHPTQSPSFLE